MNIKLYGLSCITTCIACHTGVLALVIHADVIDWQVPVAVSDVVVIGQSFAHLVPRDGGRRVAKQHDAHQCDVTAFQRLDVRTRVGYQRLHCNDDNNNNNNDNIIIYDVIIFMFLSINQSINTFKTRHGTEARATVRIMPKQREMS